MKCITLKGRMSQSILRFSIPVDIAKLDFAGLPQSSELSEALERLQVERFGDLIRISVPDIRRVTKADRAVTLELGCLLRRAKSGEFGKLASGEDGAPDWSWLWQIRPRDASGERIEIPEAQTNLPLALFEMPVRLRNILQRFGFKRASDLNGKEYQHFLRGPGMGPKTLGDLRRLVQQIREGGTVTPRTKKKQPRSACFIVPEAVRDLIPYDLPISTRLDGVLRRMGIARLGELQAMEFHELLMISGSGLKTLKEALGLIKRATLDINQPNLLRGTD